MSYTIIGVIKDGHKIAGYRLKDAHGKTADATKEQTVKAIEDGLVTNAKIQWYNGSPIVRTKEKLVTCAKVINKKIELEKPIEIMKYSGVNMIDKLKNLDKGTPLKITFTSVENYKQCLYMGYKTSPCNMNEYYFFDGSGLSGTFKFSERFIINNKDINITTEDNDVLIVSNLIQMIKGE